MQFIKDTSDYIKRNIIPISLLIFSLFNIYLLSPVLQEGFLYGDDNTSNYAYTVRIAEMIAAGNFSFWLPDFSMGQPLFFYYQPLPHLLTALLYLIFPFAEPLFIYKLLVLMALTFIPLSLYQGMRWMDFTKSMAWTGAIAVLGISSWRGFGFEYQTVFWWGQYSHLWGLVLTPLAIGYAYKSYFGHRKLFFPATLLGLVFLTHGVMGIIACLCIATLFFISEWTAKQKFKDALYLSKLFVGVFCIAAIILIPNVLYEDYMDGFSTLDKNYHTGIGIQAALTKFCTGELFDKNHYPFITVGVCFGLLMVGFGLLQSMKNNLHVKERRLILFLLLNFCLSIVLISGTQTFPFLKHTPVYNSLLVLRLLSFWHFTGLLIAAYGIGKLLEYTGKVSLQPLSIQIFKYAINLSLILFLICFGVRHFNTFSNKARVHNHISDKNQAYNQALTFLKEQEHGRLHTDNIKTHFELHLPPLYSDKPISKYVAASSHTNLGLYYLNRINKFEPTHYELFGLPYILTQKNNELNKVGESIFKNNKYEILKTTADNSYFDIVHSNTVALSHNQAARRLLVQWMYTPELLKNKEHIAIAADNSKDYFEEKGFQKFIHLKQDNKRLASTECTIENTLTNEKIETSTNGGLGKYLAHQLKSSEQKKYGEILEEHFDDGYYKAKLHVSSSGEDTPLWVLLKVNAHPDWIAKVDGKVVDWVQMSPCFMAVPVTDGVHTVEFEFGISGLRKALLTLSVLTFLGLGFFEFSLPYRIRKTELITN